MSTPAADLFAMARALQGAALCAHIVRCLRAPGLYYFAELFDLPSVSALAGPEVDLLSLLCFGTFSDYAAAPVKYSPLMTPALLRKLKLLSLASLGAATRSLSYADLRAALNLATNAEVESLVIEAIDENLIEVRARRPYRLDVPPLWFALERFFTPAHPHALPFPHSRRASSTSAIPSFAYQRRPAAICERLIYPVF